MTQEEKQLLLKDLSVRLPYHTKCYCEWSKEAPNGTSGCVQELSTFLIDELEIMGESEYDCQISGIKPYLRPLSSMTEEEAMEVARIRGLKDILSVSLKENYIFVELDDGVFGSELYTIWFNEMVTSIEMLDWLNSHHFDYRGLIEKGLALEAPEKWNIREYMN